MGGMGGMMYPHFPINHPFFEFHSSSKYPETNVVGW
jgi:hypothetical protein